MPAIRLASLAALIGCLSQLAARSIFGIPTLTDAIAEWIMAYTPSRYAVAILETLGPWAKPFAVTGGLAILGTALWFAAVLPRRYRPIPVALFASVSGLPGLVFWIPAAGVLLASPLQHQPSKRAAFVMLAGSAGVALESYIRNLRLAEAARALPVRLFPFSPPPETFFPGLVRKAVTPTQEFYGMSKGVVDPLIFPAEWRLRITVDGKLVRTVTHPELLSLPQQQRYITLRCISNTLDSDLMGNALWSGLEFHQLINRGHLPANIVEAAILGADGHSDSLPLDYAFSGQVLLATGMNGETLNRDHGAPLRLVCPRYFGFKNIKWISEIALVSKPYVGAWPRKGWSKEAFVKTASHIDRVRDTHVGGVSFAGERGIQRVEVRADGGAWIAATLDRTLGPVTWTRWAADLPTPAQHRIEARAQDGLGAWQAADPLPMFPGGVSGPTIKRVS